MLTLILVSKLCLAGAPTGPTALSIEVKPAGAQVSVDGKPVGKSGEKPLLVKVKPGKHEVKCVYKGDSHTEEVAVKAGEKKGWVFEFEGVESGPEPKKGGGGEEGGEEKTE